MFYLPPATLTNDMVRKNAVQVNVDRDTGVSVRGVSVDNDNVHMGSRCSYDCRRARKEGSVLLSGGESGTLFSGVCRQQWQRRSQQWPGA